MSWTSAITRFLAAATACVVIIQVSGAGLTAALPQAAPQGRGGGGGGDSVATSLFTLLDGNNPLNAPFKAQPYVIVDET